MTKIQLGKQEDHQQIGLYENHTGNQREGCELLLVKNNYNNNNNNKNDNDNNDKNYDNTNKNNNNLIREVKVS